MNKKDAENFMKLVEASCDTTNDISLARYRKIGELIAPLVGEGCEFDDINGTFDMPRCEHCHKVECECEICPYCKTNLVSIDDFGLTCCQECFDNHPEWQKSFNQSAYNERADSGHPINEDD